MFWWRHFYFPFQGLRGKAGAKGSKGEVVSYKRRRKTFELETTFVNFYFTLCFQGDSGKPGEAGPSGEPGIPVCI